MTSEREEIPGDACKAVLLRLFADSTDPYAFMMLVIAVGQALSSLPPSYWDDDGYLKGKFLSAAVAKLMRR